MPESSVEQRVKLAIIGIRYDENSSFTKGAADAPPQIRAALRAGDAHLVGGPTVSDAYLLQLRTHNQATLSTLRSQPGVARVESLEAEVTR